jgi:hypothetical protein
VTITRYVVNIGVIHRIQELLGVPGTLRIELHPQRLNNCALLPQVMLDLG